MGFGNEESRVQILEVTNKIHKEFFLLSRHIVCKPKECWKNSVKIFQKVA